MNQNIEKDFLKASSYAHMRKSDRELGSKAPALEMPYEGTLIELKPVSLITLDQMTLKEALLTRKTHRLYKDKALTFAELSYALYMTQGVKVQKDDLATFRTVPSAGARHPFETYVYIKSVQGLEEGFYRYIASKHALIKEENKKLSLDTVFKASRGQKSILSATVTFIWVADSYRTTHRYSTRGIRYIFLDAGHVCQNLYLIATEMQSGVCAIAAYDDQMMNDMFDFDGVNQFVCYIATLGKI